MRMMLENSSTAPGPCGKAALALPTRLSMVEEKVARPSEEAIFFIRYQPCSKYPISLFVFSDL